MIVYIIVDGCAWQPDDLKLQIFKLSSRHGRQDYYYEFEISEKLRNSFNSAEMLKNFHEDRIISK